MGVFGYHRVSSKGQNLQRGIEEIKQFCKDKQIELTRDIFVDKQSGKTFDRPRYVVMKEDVLREGDTLIITEIDRLGRNKKEIVNELNDFKNKGVRLMILELPTTLMQVSEGQTTINKLLIDTIMDMITELYACLAEAEIEKKTKRQTEGITAMKKSGDWDRYGRPRKLDNKSFEKVYQKVINGELKPFEAMRQMKLTKPTYYRYKKEYEAKQTNQ